jgi:proline dehydrogenase
MLRAALLWLSEQPHIFRFVRRNRLARRLASRFVAGELPEDGVGAVRELNKAGIRASLDQLGESVTSADEARRARDVYLDTLDRIKAAGVDSNVSVKLTQMGLDIGEDLAIENLSAIAARAQEHNSFVRIDMEGSAYTQRTLDLFKREFHPRFGNAVGVVLQSYLRRTAQDVEDMIALGARVRLCKGAYKEPPEVAFPDKLDVDANYIACMERLLDCGHYPGIATHDERIIARARAFVSAKRIPPERYEFQMLYGVRRDLQLGLRKDGYGMRVYVPFGTHWYPYLMRRLAERPANIAFLSGSLLRESLRRRPADGR